MYSTRSRSTQPTPPKSLSGTGSRLPVPPIQAAARDTAIRRADHFRGRRSMFTRSGIGAALVLVLLAPAALSAQTPSQQRSVIFFANGGGASPVTDLNDAGTASLKTGWTGGGGIGLQLNPYVAVRGTFDFTRTEGEGTAAGALASSNLNHYFY